MPRPDAQPPDRGFADITVRVAGGLVVAASLLCGARALSTDLTTAFRSAAPTVFSPYELGQFAIVRERVPAGSSILLTANAGSSHSWYSRLWQRAFYPRNTVIVRPESLPALERKKLRERYGFRFAVSLGQRPADLDFQSLQDLGALPGLPDHVWFGELTP